MSVSPHAAFEYGSWGRPSCDEVILEKQNEKPETNEGSVEKRWPWIARYNERRLYKSCLVRGNCVNINIRLYTSAQGLCSKEELEVGYSSIIVLFQHIFLFTSTTMFRMDILSSILMYLPGVKSRLQDECQDFPHGSHLKTVV